jgi:hypothetical protein
MLRMFSGADDAEVARAYARQFCRLCALAEKLNVPRERVGDLVRSVFMATAIKDVVVEDEERWLTAAVTAAARSERA